MARILIDGYNLALEQGTGVATYARNLTQAIGALGHEAGVLYGNRTAYRANPLIQEIALFDPHSAPRQPYWRKQTQSWFDQLTSVFGVTARHVPITGAVINRQHAARMPSCSLFYNSPNIFKFSRPYFNKLNSFVRVGFDQPPGIFHWTYPLPVKANGCANIYTLHDLVPLRLPFTTLDNKRYYFRLVKKIADEADHIVTVSEHSRQDIISLLNVPPERVTNTYQAVSVPRRFIDRPDDEIAHEVQNILGLGYKKYFLFFGAMDPKKNIARIVQAYQGARTDMPLLVIGGLAWRLAHQRRLATKSQDRQAVLDLGPFPDNPRVQLVDYLPFDLLMTAIRGARAVIFPSLYEGFGLPILEAMQLGTPVISSTESSIPEIAGDAALLVDPYDTDAIRQAIETLAVDDGLCAELSARGPRQTAKFSAENHNARLKAVYSKFV